MNTIDNNNDRNSDIAAFNSFPTRLSPPDPVYEVLREYFEHRRQLIDDGIATFLQRHYEGTVLDIVRYATTGGKRLRGILTILICEALEGDASDALPAAVAVELAHAASLAHDDVIDGDAARRGRPALHVRYDTAIAILIPHLIVPQSVLSAQIYGLRAISTILEGWACTVKGQVHDYILPGSGDSANYTDDAPFPVDRNLESKEKVEREYREIIREKTAALFETAAALGAIAARDDSNTTLVQTYAALLGSAFQIGDDATDLEFHANQPWSILLGAGTAYSGRSLYALHRMVNLEGEKVITADAIARVKHLASLDIEGAAACAAMFPASPVRDLLFAFPAFAIDQIYAEVREDARQSRPPESDPTSGGS